MQQAKLAYHLVPRVAPAVDPVNDIHESKGGVAGVSEVKICPIFLPQIGGEKNSP